VKAEILISNKARVKAGDAAGRRTRLWRKSGRRKVSALAALICLGAVTIFADTALVFNEIMYHPQTNETTFEWVELYNQMAVDLDVSGWTIQIGIDYKFPAGTIVHGGSYVVVSISPADLILATGLTNVLGPFTQRLSNSGETLELHNNDGRLEDSISYGTDGDWPVGPDGAGVSLAKLDRNTASGPAENWAMSEQVGGTPGAVNFPSGDPPDRTLVFNEISAATNALFWLELLNSGANDIPLDGVVLARQGSTDATYSFPSGQMLAAGAFVALDETQLAFRPQSGDRLFLYPATRDRVLDAVIVKDRLRGRSPDGKGEWRHPDHPTAGASNSFAFHTEIVINEIMYDHYPTRSVSGVQASTEQWIELYNRSSNSVDLTGWRLDGGIQFNFASGQTMAPGAYLVVAKKAEALRPLYPTITIVGDFSNSLSRHHDVVVLKDPNDDPVNRVPYYDEGRWPMRANKGGSSLELRDPMADNSKAEAWAASDETHKSSWSNYTYSAVASNDNDPTVWNEFILGLLADGECLVDDISVQELSTNQPPVELVANGDFENGITGWRVLGDHGASRVEIDSDNPGNHVLHVIATGPTEHMHNHVETTYIGDRTVEDGRTYRVSFRAKWLAGVNLLNTRLYFNRVHQTSVLPVPPLNGTPGSRNSRLEANIGPTFSHFQHRPVVPESNQEVTVSVRAEDPQGVSSCSLLWSVAGGSWSNSPMSLQDVGLYAATIPGLPAGTVVQFYVEALDNLGAASMFPARGPASRALYQVNDGQAALSLGHNIRIIMTPADIALMNAPTNLMSNDNLGTTVVTDEQRAYYDMTARLKGSERGRTTIDRVGFHLNFNPDDLFRGVHPVMLIDRSGQGGNFGQEEILIKHMINHAGGMPEVYSDLCRVIDPTISGASSAIFFPRFEDDFLPAQYPGADAGPLFEFELIYFPLTTSDGTPTGYKLPQPDSALGVDISDLGDDKEDYRFRFIIKNNREVDDYSRLIDLCKTFSLTGPALDAQSQRVMDVDQWLRVFVMEALCGVDEIYNAWDIGNPHNVLLYVRSSDQKVVTFPWDMDWCFMEPTDVPLYGNQNLSQIITLPANLRATYAHALDIIDTTFNPAYMAYWVNHYTNFCPGQDFSPILTYIDQRSRYIRQSLAFCSTNIFGLFGSTSFSTNSDLITIRGTAPVQVRTILVNGLAYPVVWRDETRWSLSLALIPGTNSFQLQGYDMHGNVLSNAALSLTANYTGPVPDPQGAIVINEIMYNPLIPDTAFVELRNTSTNLAFNLTGWRLDGVGFTFPPTVMTQRQILVLVKDADAFTTAYGNNIPVAGVFGGRLEPAGEILSLIKPGATPDQDTVIDRVRYESSAPWPAEANGAGASLQLIDASQDHSRVSNWAASPGISTPGRTNSVTSALPVFPPLWINEVQPDNLAGITDDRGQRDPWLELYNAGANPLELDGFFLANNYTNLAQWSFPTGTVINAGEFKLVFADGQSEQTTASELHTSFRLSSGTGSIALSRTYAAALQLLDYINYSAVHSNLSFGSFPDGQPFYRQEMYYVTPGATNNGASPPQGVFINEWMASNTGFILDPADNAKDDYFELYNPGTAPVNLAGYFLTDTLSDKFQYQIPAGYVIPPLGYLLVWADNSPGQNSSSRPDLHVNFALSKGGEAIGLFGPDGTEIDSVTFGPQTNNISQGRYPDGAPSIYFMTTPTPRAANIPTFNNRPPTLASIGNQSVFAGQTLGFTISATDTDLPPQTLTFSLNAGKPEGASVDASTGVFSWTPTSAQAPSTNLLSVTVTDNGTPNLSATRAFQIIVYKVNSAPTLPVLEDQVVNELTLLVVTNTANDADLPDTILTYTLMNPPLGASIDTNGIITWIPSEAQGPGTAVITTVVTDNGIPNLSATNSFTVTVQEVNSAPVLPAILDQTIVVSTLLTISNTATDADLPANGLTYTLVNPPDGASIDTNGTITWIPSEAQVRTTNLLTTVVTDDGFPGLSATNQFTVVVREVNVAPVLPVIDDQTINELTLLTVTNAATDVNLPADNLTYTLVNPPGGASIDTNGIITWIPAEAQGPSTNEFTTVVTDHGLPSLSATNRFMVIVEEVNTAPVLPLVADQTISELTLMIITNAATDVDLPANALTYTLVSPPDGATIDTSGIITWIPSEAQGPGSAVITTVVTDNGIPSLSATNSFTVTVQEVNTAPVLPVIGDQTVNELTLLTVTNAATDSDLPANALAYALLNPPEGAAIDPNGIITWMPSESQGPSTNILITVVTDNGLPNLSATNSFTVIVQEVNTAPVLPFIADQAIDELTLLIITNTATDSDLPTNTVTYTLIDPPAGASIDTNGIITSIPSEAQGPGTAVITTVVTDNGIPNLSATNSFTVVVNEINLAPILPAQPDRTVNPLTLLIVTNTAVDPDIPANALTYVLVNPPDGANIDTNGVITWTPDETQAPNTYTLTTIVTDYNPDAVNAQQLSATNSFLVTVIETRPLFTLLTASDGGAIDLVPAGGRYPANTAVQATARPSAGWTFLGWRGALDGGNSVGTVLMDRSRSLRALFGTWLDTQVSGDGAIQLYPTNRLAPFGTTVQVVAVPGTNSSLAHWNVVTGNGAVSATANPITYVVSDPMIVFEAVFEPMDVGQATLTVIPDGRGQISITPLANRYNLGGTVHILAVPEPGQTFLRWTGDEKDTSPSLDVTLDRSKVITATFSKRPRLDPAVDKHWVSGEAFRLILTGDAGTDYEILGSDDLQAWTQVDVVNSPFGTAQATDSLSINYAHRFYRAVSPPGYAPPPPTPPVTLVSTGSVWKYLDNGSDQGTSWVTSGFDDTAWAAGRAQLGYGDGDEATVVSFGPDENNKYITTYFRHSFSVTNAAIFTNLSLGLLRDDGAVVYLNGQEVFRSNMPGGVILYSTLASSGVADAAENVFYATNIAPSLLVNGTNTFAIEVHQVSPQSSDVSFDFRLFGQPE